jgi:hypothetical protein
MMALQTKNKVSTTLSRMSKKELLNLLTNGWGIFINCLGKTKLQNSPFFHTACPVVWDITPNVQQTPTKVIFMCFLKVCQSCEVGGLLLMMNK